MGETRPKTEFDTAPATEPTLDPADWDAFRNLAHWMLDACIDRVASAREHPWRPTPPETIARLSGPAPREGAPLHTVMGRLLSDILPYGTGNTHPRFFGWVHGTGVADGLLAAIAEAAMNSNCGGRDHVGMEVERRVIAWAAEAFGFPETSGGILTSGASMATLLGLLVARQGLRERVGRDAAPAEALRVYAARGAHACVEKALSTMGGAEQAVVRIETLVDGGMDLSALRAAIAADRAAGLAPLAIVGTVGAVETGVSDDLNALADLAAAETLWLHVDGAFGAWARLAEAPWNACAAGLERADSLAFDFHKWPSVAYDCGCVLVRDRDLHRRAFSNRPDYLRSAEQGLAGGDLWFTDYGIELSRGFRALKTWVALSTHGLDGIGAIVTKNCRQAAEMARLVSAAPEALTLCFEPQLNVCCFWPEPQAEARPIDPEADARVRRLAAALQLDGSVVFSTTRIRGREALRAAIVNHRTEMADIQLAIDAVRRKRSALFGRAV